MSVNIQAEVNRLTRNVEVQVSELNQGIEVGVTASLIYAFSPIAKVQPLQNGNYLITITDRDGTTTAEVPVMTQEIIDGFVEQYLQHTQVIQNYIQQHNISDSAHADIRLLIQNAFDSIPTRVSQLQNDVGYVSNIPTPDWEAGVQDGGYINNKPSIRKGTDTNHTGIAEGIFTTASGIASHAEGDHTTASTQAAHAQGSNTVASNTAAHAQGSGTRAQGVSSHAEGGGTTASGMMSHAEGTYTTASGNYSHTQGEYTVAASTTQHVQGKYNVIDYDNIYAHIVGNGTANSRANIHTLDWNGNAIYAGRVTASDPAAASDLTTKRYVDNAIPTNNNQLINGAGYQTASQVSSAIANALEGFVGVSYHVCQNNEYNLTTLVPTLEGETGVIYLVPKINSVVGVAIVGSAELLNENNIYIEYIYDGTKFEKIGDTSVNLNGYLKEQDIATDASVNNMLDELGLFSGLVDSAIVDEALVG